MRWSFCVVWKDKLVSYDGNTITYDNIGNPLSDGTWTYTWTQGRRLRQITDGTSTIASYKYNADGIRTEKTVGGTTTKFNLVGSNITWQKTGSSDPIYFLYDSGGKLWGLEYDGNTYFYARNAQGDIIKIVNSSGTVVVEYAYDAWGNPMGTTGTLASTLGEDNPFRYRGYYYDEETGLYYLNQRYYNAEWGRFINADDVLGQTGGLLTHNAFAYCANNPVMFSDPSGRFKVGNYYETDYTWVSEYHIKKVLKRNAKKAKNEIGLDFLKFKAYVEDQAPWDYKYRDNREADPLLAPIASMDYIYYNGTIMDWEQFGNFHYSYVGRAAGFSLPILSLGSIYAADFVIDNNEMTDQGWVAYGYYSYLE